MRIVNNCVKLFCVLAVILVCAERLFGWGFWGHKEINKRAIQLLPTPMKDFFLAHANYISEHAVDPDMRRFRDTLEAYNHYIDVDYYGTYPFTALPRNYDSAVVKFGLANVRKQGIVPWRIAAYTDSLCNAMKKRDEQAVLHFASELGHYVADAHVPLHAVVDYDGVQRGQKGVHKRWESDYLERFGQAYDFPTQGAKYIGDPLIYAFNTILESYSFADSVFYADAEAQRKVPPTKRIGSVRSHGDTVLVFADAYYDSLKALDRGLAERRMQKAIVALASYWYTAWVNAGKPELPTAKKP